MNVKMEDIIWTLLFLFVIATIITIVLFAMVMEINPFTPTTDLLFNIFFIELVVMFILGLFIMSKGCDLK